MFICLIIITLSEHLQMPSNLSYEDTGPPRRHGLLSCTLNWDLEELCQDMPLSELLSPFKMCVKALKIILCYETL